MKFTTYSGCTPSFSECLIMTKLKSLKIHYEREVSFAGLINPKTGQPLRYDFYIPKLNILIEYDGKASHSTAEVQARDRIKNKFAKNNRIQLFRISGIKNIDAFFESEKFKRIEAKRVEYKKTVKHKKKPLQVDNTAKDELKAVLERRQMIANGIEPPKRKIYPKKGKDYTKKLKQQGIKPEKPIPRPIPPKAIEMPKKPPVRFTFANLKRRA